MMKFPIEVKPILEELMESPRFKKRWAEHLIQSKWESWVGKRIALHIRPRNLKNDQLTVIIDDERWASSFDTFKDKILENIGKDLGSTSIKGFIVVIDKKKPGLKRQKKGTKEKAQNIETSKVQPSNSTRSLGKGIEMELNSIKDLTIRDSLRRLIIKDLSSRQK